MFGLLFEILLSERRKRPSDVDINILRTTVSLLFCLFQVHVLERKKGEEKMKRKVEIFVGVVLVSFLAAAPLFAEPTASALSQTIRPVSSPSIEIQGNSLTDRISVDSDDSNALLPMVSDFLNQSAQARSENSFESLRRNAIFQVEQNLTSQFLAFNSSKRSA